MLLVLDRSKRELAKEFRAAIQEFLPVIIRNSIRETTGDSQSEVVNDTRKSVLLLFEGENFNQTAH